MCGTNRRPGFSMIELLIVMVIISVLLAIAVGVYTKFIGVQQNSNTNTQIKKIHDLLQKRWNAEIKAARDDFRAKRMPKTAMDTVMDLAGQDFKRAEVIYVKLRLRRAFPMTFAEATIPFSEFLGVVVPPIVPPQDYQTLWPLTEFQQVINKQYGISKFSPTSPPQACESAVCLLIALQRATGGGGVDAEDLGGAAVGTLSFDVGGGTKVPVQGLVDGNGSPLAFCRWPTGNLELNPKGAEAAPPFRDPGDPEGTLTDFTWLTANPATATKWKLFVSTKPLPMNYIDTGVPLRTAFERLCHNLPNRSTRNAPALSYKLSPMIASPGADKSLGLDFRTFTPVPPDSNDNVYSSTSVP
jgi:prepilin-type N-terminal cleavage/methylation domain-containing protein